MAEPKTIYCPRCGRKVLTYNGRSKINPVAKCQKCKKLVVYHVDTEKAEMKAIPPRDSSSGMRFY